MRKRGILFGLCFAMFVSILAFAGMEAKASDQWDGTIDTRWFDGVSAATYDIYTAEELAGLAYLVNTRKTEFLNMTINLKADLDLSGHEWIPIDWGGWTDQGRGCPGFRGIFDGQNHTISNLKITTIKADPNYAGKLPIGDDEYYSEVGLFGRMDGELRNLKMENAQINLKEDEARKVITAGFFAGTICHDGPDSDGIEKPGIHDCEVNNSEIYGIGIAYASSFSGKYYDDAESRDCVANNSSIIIGTSDDLSQIYDRELYASYNGTNTFYINTDAELAAIVKLSEDGRDFAGREIYLCSDLDMSPYEWRPIQQFAGVFKGQNHSIGGLHAKATSSGQNMALIANTKGCQIQDLSLSVDFPTAAYNGSVTAGFIAEIDDSGTVLINNCSIYGEIGRKSDIQASGASPNVAGGFVGEVEKCSGLGISNCRDYATVTADRSGGIVGRISRSSASIISNMVYADAGTGKNGHAGGIVGASQTSTLLIEGCGVNGTKNSGTETLNIYGGKYVGGMIGSIYNAGFNMNYQIIIRNSFCNAQIILNDSEGIAAGLYNIRATNMYGQDTYKVSGSYFGGALTYVPVDSKGKEHMFGCYGLKTSDTSIEKGRCIFTFANVFILHQLFVNNSPARMNNYQLTPSTWEDTNIGYFNAKFQDNLRTEFTMNIGQEINFNLLNILNTLGQSTENTFWVEWTSTPSYDFGLPIFSKPVSMQNEIFRIFCTANIIISGDAYSNMPNNSYSGFTDSYAKADGSRVPWQTVNVNSGMTFRVDVTNALSDSNHSEQICYSSQLFQQGDVIEMYVVKQDRSGFAAGPYTYTISGSEDDCAPVSPNMRRLPIQNFKDAQNNSLDAIRSGFQSLVFNVKFGANSRRLEDDTKECVLSYDSGYKETSKNVYLKHNNISLQIENSIGGEVLIDSSYRSEDDPNTYLSNSKIGFPIQIAASPGYVIKEILMDNQGIEEGKSVNEESMFFIWQKEGKWTLKPTFEKKMYSVTFEGEHVTLCDPDGNPVKVTDKKIAYEKVAYEDSYSFTLKPIDDWGIVEVMVNGQTVTPNQDDIYTVANIKDAVRIKVTTVRRIAQPTPRITGVPQTVTYGDTDFTLIAADGQGTGEYQWSSDDEDILQIDSLGKVSVKKTGTTKIKLFKEGDYQYLDSEEVSVQITVQPKKITVMGLKAFDKTYDGNDKAQIITKDAVITGLVTGDDLDIEFNEGKFASKDAGDSIAIIPGKCTLTGDDASNYELGAAPVIPKARIEKAPLKVSVNDIIIDKGQTATLKVSVKGFVNGETESTDSTYSRPVAKASFDSLDTALTSVNVAYSGGNAGRNYKFESYSKTARITINKVSASASDVIFDADRNEWHKSINLTPGKGYHKISGDGSTFSNDLTITTEGENQITVYLKKADGTVTEGVTVTCRIDTTSPTDLKVKYGDGEFHAMANSTGFNHFVKGASAVTATASDALSGIASLAYYASATAVTDFTSVSWQNSLTLPDRSKQIVYVKATDKAGNDSIACEGVVVYQNSVISPNSFVFDLNAPQNIATTVSLLGNGLKEIKNGQSTLTAGTDYVLDGEKLTVLSGYLVSALGAGNIDLTLYFTPMGEETGQVTVSALLAVSNHKHSTTKTEAVAATHFKTGNIEYYTCAICNRIYTDELCTNEITIQDTITQVIPHNVEGKAWEHDATNHWKTCECGEKMDTSTHSFVWVIDRVATVEEAGLKHEVCEICGSIRSENTEITKLDPGHIHSVDGKAWEHDAANHWKTCACGEKIGVSVHDVTDKAWEHDAANHWKTCECGEKIDTATHVYIWVIDRAATVEQTGLKHEVCEVCGSVRSENTEIPKLDPVHVHSVEGKNWDFDGTNHWKTCDCSERFAVEAHHFVWVIDKNASKTEAGVKHEECMICGCKRNEGTEIPKLTSEPEPVPEEVNPLKWYYEPKHPGTLCKMMPQGEACMEAFRKEMPEGYEEAFTFNFSFVEDSYEPRYSSKKGYFQLAYPEEYRKEGRSFTLIGINQSGETKLFYDTDKYDETIAVTLDVDGYAFLLIYSDTVEQQNIYVVKKGDTLSQIAVKLKTTVSYLIKVNQFEDPDKLYIGQKIIY